ncbi:tuberin-like isoform X1 [Mytilus trossulus]|uniref:tuberin-like isoform X1 n=2 Tax=Mytilus trossulus TaxID=6551 RepID=UPI0030068E38
MSKKNEDNLKDKIKNLLGFSKEKDKPITFQKSQTKEIVFTPERLREIGPESPANNRLRTIRELSEVVLNKRLEENAIEALWHSIKDLVQSTSPSESRIVALHFLKCLLEGQYQYLGILRGFFFHVIECLTVPSDTAYRLDLLLILSEHGRNLHEFEEDAGPFLLQWMPQVRSSGKIKQYLELIVNVIKFNAAYLDEPVLSGIVKQTCMVTNKGNKEEINKGCLDVLNTVLCYSYLPTECLDYFIAALCRMVNMAHFCQSSWDLMRKLLGTHLGHSTIYTMCCMLQNRRQPIDHELLRGAVFFIGMALWGCKKVPSLKHTASSVLPSFLQVLSTNSYLVGHEVILSVQRLLKKYGKELQYVTWNCILDIMESLLKLFETPVQPTQSGFTQMVANLHEILTTIEELYAHGHYSGCVSRFFKIIELCSTKRPESSVSMLIDYDAQQIHPGKENWLSNMYQLLDKYFRHEHRTVIRVKALTILSFTLSVNKHMHEDDLINNVVLPHLSHIDTDKDPVVRKVAADILICLAQSCSPACFADIIGLLDKLITRPMVAYLTSPHPGMDGSDMLQKLEESHLVDIKTSLLGLVDLFKAKLYTRPSNQCLKLYELLITHMKNQYSSPKEYVSYAAATVRKAILESFLLLRCDSLHRLGFIDKNQEDNQFIFSPYIVCQTSEEDEEDLQPCSPPEQTSSAAFLWSQAALLSYDEIFNMFIDCLEHDKDWQVMECVLVNLPLLLQNKSLVLSTNRNMVDVLCQKLCSMVNDRQLGFPEKLQSVPPGKFTRSDFHTFIFPVLVSLVSYHSYLDKNKQRQLIKCLEFGLVSKCSKICTNSLRICTLEMQDVMMRLLPSVLLQLSKISATVHMAIPVLAFLSSIVRLPKMYANFVEDEYMSVFAIALPYTNPFKFSHYTVSLAHHIIAIWFIRCRMPFRKGFVKFIQKGLKANVLKHFEDNSLSHLNQDSSERGRSATYNEPAFKARRRISSGPGNSPLRSQSPPVDDKMSVFHKELTETCTDIMSRYTFANYSAVPQRSQVAEFLLNGGQSQTWSVGNKLITITTSGGAGTKYNSSGVLCDKCMAHYQPQSQPAEPKTPVTPGRRRHRSAFVGRSTSLIDNSKGSIDDIGVQSRLSFNDDMSLEDALEGQDIGVQTGTSLTEHTPKSGFESENLESILCGSMNKSTDGRMFSNYQCNCWCTGWAEVYIRSPSGVIGWMMRIENETSMTSLQDPQFHDFTILFANFRNAKQPDIDSLSSRIDVDSLGEEEYVSLYDQHFPSDHGSSGGLFAECAEGIQILIDGNNKIETNGQVEKEDTKDSSNQDESIISMLKRSTSSPSLLETGNNHSGEKDPMPSPIADSNKLLHDSESNLHKTVVDGPKVKEDGINLNVVSTRPSNISKSTNILSPTSPNTVNLPQLSLSPESSESSAHDELPDLPAFKKQRGHTISVVTPERGHEERSGGKDAGRGGINPSFVFLQLYFGGMLHHGDEMPLLLPQSDVMKRAINNLDRIYPFATHKIGVVYVGSRQTKDEKEILSNQSGSERYIKFLQGLGQLIRLHDCDPNKVYIGGLNKDGSDGQYCYGWQDETLHVIYHVATLMPNKESDPNCNSKKLHIGNDYVTVVYNDSGEDYRIGTIKGQFNYVNIVIKPLDYESNAITLQAKEVPFQDSITTDIAEILGHKDTKVISDQHLSDLVRQIAVNCNLASLVLQRQQSNPEDPFASNPLERLRQIKRIKQKALLELGLQNPTEQDHKGQKLDDFTEFV